MSKIILKQNLDDRSFSLTIDGQEIKAVRSVYFHTDVNSVPTLNVEILALNNEIEVVGAAVFGLEVMDKKKRPFWERLKSWWEAEDDESLN